MASTVTAGDSKAASRLGGDHLDHGRALPPGRIGLDRRPAIVGEFERKPLTLLMQLQQ